MIASHRPNLFIVGGPRCGTTAMHRYLCAHPRVRMSRKKEPTYFGSDLRLPNVGRPTLDDYLAHFNGKDGAIWRGEASVTYLFSRRAAAEIKGFRRLGAPAFQPASPSARLDAASAACWRPACRQPLGEDSLPQNRAPGASHPRRARPAGKPALPVPAGFPSERVGWVERSETHLSKPIRRNPSSPFPFNPRFRTNPEISTLANLGGRRELLQQAIEALGRN
jgi:hypothetical protein